MYFAHVSSVPGTGLQNVQYSLSNVHHIGESKSIISVSDLAMDRALLG